MRTQKRLGKGLEDISSLFLASSKSPDSETDSKPANKEYYPQIPSRRICIIRTDEQSYQDFYLVYHLANILSRLGIRIAIIDLSENLLLTKYLKERHSIEVDSSQSPRNIFENTFGVKYIALDRNIYENRTIILKNEKLITEFIDIERKVDLLLLHTDISSFYRMIPQLKQSVRDFLITHPPEKDKLMDSYKIIKNIYFNNPQAKIGVVVSAVNYFYEMDVSYKKISYAVRKYLKKEIFKYGFLFEVTEKHQSRELNMLEGDSNWKDCLSNIAQNIIFRLKSDQVGIPHDSFFEKLLASQI
jgi:MinD-like ATPase involved in chromosome partitioning or flagellar assembly